MKEPKMPSNRLWCDACGDISKTGKHTNWICRLLIWIDGIYNE